MPREAAFCAPPEGLGRERARRADARCRHREGVVGTVRGSLTP